MNQKTNPTDTQHSPLEKILPPVSLESLHESGADLTRICWTQWLRQPEQESDSRAALPLAPDDGSPSDPSI
jgi:hypothetical protein